jgi:predicted nucleic acid-binding protein
VNFVVDASVAIKWFVREERHEQALLLLDHAEQLQAPDLIVTEVTNVAWKKSIRHEITAEQARVITVAMRQFIPSLRPSVELAERALDIALTLNHPVYDCLYLACADVDPGLLVTADRRLYDIVQGTAFQKAVRFLGEPDFLGDEGRDLRPLQISPSKVEHVIREAEAVRLTKQNIQERSGKPFTNFVSEEFQIYWNSIRRLRLIDYIDGLSRSERADLLALLWLGSGTQEGRDLESLRKYAFERADAGCDGNYIVSKGDLADWLILGLQKLHREREGD